MTTETATHTPGPWRVGDAGATVFGPPNGNPAPTMIAQRIRAKANARLIAAAPALLAAAQLAVDAFIDEHYKCVDDDGELGECRIDEFGGHDGLLGLAAAIEAAS